ncbi:MAG TPA: peptide deformylase [Prolixibacteraceae bacterium]|nr:peptide deformylase [Prolixibacteraceae bacterium]
MKAKTLLILFVSGILYLVLFAACQKAGFRPEELERIEDGLPDQPMRLYTLFQESDSLFLREEARQIRKRDLNKPTLELLKKRMLATVTDTLNPGVGLAAPQIGVGVRMICVQRFDREGEPFECYLNPNIEFYGDSINSGPEGCLSVPGFRGRVDRSHNITLAHLGWDGDMKNEEIEGFTAVIFQHEIDHLNGIFYFDRIFNGFQSLSVVNE